MNQTSLCEKILTSGGNMTLVLDNLEKRGLVERRRDTEDRRAWNIYLTDEGRSLIERIMPSHVDGIVHEFRTLSQDDQRVLGDLCRRVGLAITG